MARPLKELNPAQPEPTEAELHLLHHLWKNGPSTVRQVWESSGSKGSYTTVLKQFQVMLEKGLLTRDDSAKIHVFSAAIQQQKVKKSLLSRLMTQMFEGSAAQLALGALSTRKVSADERAEIRKLLDELDRKDTDA
jgi:BlaI family penicillinase repressor